MNSPKIFLLKIYQWLEPTLLKDVEKIEQVGLAIGGNLNNAIV